MKYYVEEDLRNFNFWSGAVNFAQSLTIEQFEKIEEYLNETEPEDGWSDTEINDFFWHDEDFIRKEILNIDDSGNEIGSYEWAEDYLTDKYSEEDYIEMYMEEFSCFHEGEFSNYTELNDNYSDFVNDNFKDMNGNEIHIGCEVYWYDPAEDDYKSEEDYDEQCKIVREVIAIESGKITLYGDTEVLAEELEVII